MRTAIIGSRSFNDYEYLREVLNGHIVPISKIITGGADGADKLAEQYANENNIETEIYLPDYKRFGRGAPIKRNELIIEASEQVIAFWDGKSKGTMSAVKKAREKDIAVFLFYS
jgi:hypothetical protein